MSTEENKQLVHYLYGELARGNLEAINEVYAPEVRYHGSQVLLGRAAVRVQIEGYAQAAPDMSVDTVAMVAEGDRVVTLSHIRGTHTGPLQDISPTGHSFSITGVSIMRLEDGRIVEEWELVDELSLLQQLGIIPSLQGQPA